MAHRECLLQYSPRPYWAKVGWAHVQAGVSACCLPYRIIIWLLSSVLIWLLQVVKNAKQTQARKANKAGGYADDDTKPAEEPKRWSDYTVSHLSAFRSL